MSRYSIQPMGRIFVKGYQFLSFVENMCKKLVKNVSKNLSSKYNQKLLDHAKQFETDALKTASRTPIQKTAEATGDLIGNKITDKIIKVARTSQKDN